MTLWIRARPRPRLHLHLPNDRNILTIASHLIRYMHKTPKHMRSCTDRPGRYIAVFAVSPLLGYSAWRIHMCDLPVAYGIATFAVILLFYEIFWICSRPNDVALLPSAHEN